ncbi:MAG TPA: hypothetical protein VE709_04375 [Pseudonocardiaceae bacterium]|nr:hypothetical protein [Pseudonocardiaceae bacterium]
MTTVLAGCGGGTEAPETVTVTAPPLSPPSTARAVKDVTLPEVPGQNGAIVFEQLTEPDTPKGRLR